MRPTSMLRLTQQFLKPPGTLLIPLFVLTLASVSALAWFAWQFVEQERLVEAQRALQHLEESADRLATSLRGALAETADQLTDAAEPIGEDSVLLVFRGTLVTASPAGQLLYHPFDSLQARDADNTTFAEAEMFEFLQNQPDEAVRIYQKLANTSSDVAIRAGATLRLARVHRSRGRIRESRAAWERLAGMPASANVSGIPAQIAALLELGDRASVVAGLRQGRWPLSQAQFEYYWEQAAAGIQPPADALAVSEAAARAWRQVLSNPDGASRGQEIIWAGSRPWLAIWRGASRERRAILLTSPVEWLKRAARSAPASQAGIEYALVDGQGRMLAGQKPATSGRAAIRPAAETQLPWTIYATAVGSTSMPSLAVRQHFLLSGIAVMVVFLLVGTYFVARTIRREAEVARMQSNFVSAVSHEFRSPLTSMRQLSEILALGRVPSEERRQLYYETLVRETTRLQRIVEALLNFGRFESGTRRFVFQQFNIGSAIRRSVAEFEQEWSITAARTIELAGTDEDCQVEADPEAIGVALRNLLDNAIKYSPASSPVHVTWRRRDGQVIITVQDHGAGITEREQRTIFQRFVRGSAAASGNVKGSGLGLAMVHDIVAAHRGQVTVTSKPGKGSIFAITLPASLSVAEQIRITPITS